MERMYQFLWQSRMLGSSLRDADGRRVDVIDPGLLNTDSGPDFFNSKLKIDGTEWVGNVEIHVKASDWFRHHHDTDPAYDNVILHVVAVGDRRVTLKDGRLIPQVEVALPEDFAATYDTLSHHTALLRCAGYLSQIPQIAVTDWLESLAIERLQMKARRVADTLEQTGGDWEQTCFITISRALGFGLNGEPFEMLARSLLLRILHHHSDNPVQTEALLFGQAGMLDSSQHIFDEYYQLLCREYFFLARKYGLRPMRVDLWKYARTRPQNFPHRRIAYLAKACEGGFRMFSRLVGASGLEEFKGLFGWRLEGYWRDNFDFGGLGLGPAPQPHGAEHRTRAGNGGDSERTRHSGVGAPPSGKGAPRSGGDMLSAGSVRLLLINAVAPLLYAYGNERGDYEAAERAMGLLEQLPGESNVIVRDWESCGLRGDTAMRSQALIHLRREYCEKRNCLRCRFGHAALRRTLKL